MCLCHYQNGKYDKFVMTIQEDAYCQELDMPKVFMCDPTILGTRSNLCFTFFKFVLSKYYC